MTTLEQSAGERSGRTLTRFAFYGRVSTEDNRIRRHPARGSSAAPARSSLRAEARSSSSSLTWTSLARSPGPRRPHATALLAELKNPNRGFDAVVVGEPHRAFYGNQYGLTFPVFEHFGVGMWVPEVGGPIDPANEAYDMIMGVFGGLSKGERNRIKLRVRARWPPSPRPRGATSAAVHHTVIGSPTPDPTRTPPRQPTASGSIAWSPTRQPRR
jgi:hypothetical protein